MLHDMMLFFASQMSLQTTERKGTRCKRAPAMGDLDDSVVLGTGIILILFHLQFSFLNLQSLQRMHHNLGIHFSILIPYVNYQY